MKIVVVGCGRVGGSLAELYDRDGHDVTVLDVRTDAFDRLPTSGGKAIRATAPTRTRFAAKAPRAPTCSSP